MTDIEDEGGWAGESADPGTRPASYVPLEPQDEIHLPGPVGRYVLPSETRGHEPIATRLHPVRLLVPAAVLLGSVLAAAVLNGIAYQRGIATVNLVRFVWLLALAGAGYAVWRWLAWRQTWFVITRKRLVYITGLFTRRVTPLPLTRLRDLDLERPLGGRQLGYGTLICESIGTGHALERVAFLPYPDQLFNEIWSLKLYAQSTAPDAPEDGW